MSKPKPSVVGSAKHGDDRDDADDEELGLCDIKSKAGVLDADTRNCVCFGLIMWIIWSLGLYFLGISVGRSGVVEFQFLPSLNTTSNVTEPSPTHAGEQATANEPLVASPTEPRIESPSPGTPPQSTVAAPQTEPSPGPGSPGTVAVPQTEPSPPIELVTTTWLALPLLTEPPLELVTTTPCSMDEEVEIAELPTGGMANSNRLGNFLNEWALGGTCPRASGTCKKGLPPLELAAVDNECHGRPYAAIDATLNPLGLGQAPGTLGDYLKQNLPAYSDVVTPFCGGNWWWAYYYVYWQALGEYFKTQIRPIITRFAQERAPHLLKHRPHEIVVHYRIGDPYTGSPEPRAALRGVQELATRIGEVKRIVVLFCSYLVWTDANRAPIYERMGQAFLDLLRVTFPCAKVTTECRTADEDWLRMALAGNLVTTHGSYAVSAAAANDGQRATLGIPNLNFPRIGQNGLPEVPVQVAENWITYKLVGNVLD